MELAVTEHEIAAHAASTGIAADVLSGYVANGVAVADAVEAERSIERVTTGGAESWRGTLCRSCLEAMTRGGDAECEPCQDAVAMPLPNWPACSDTCVRPMWHAGQCRPAAKVVA